MAPDESKDERDRRVAKLWQRLGVPRDGRLDFNGLKKGLKKIDHREHDLQMWFPCCSAAPPTDPMTLRLDSPQKCG